MKVRIQASQIVYYDQEVEMTQEDFDKLYNCEEIDIDELTNEEAYHIVQSHINNQDVLDAANEFENVEVSQIL